jgi:cobalt/nickel transport protein
MNFSISAAFTGAAICLALTIAGRPADAHFGMVIPDQPVLTDTNRSTDITLSFSHPFEGMGMKLEKPKRFFMVQDGNQTDLTDELETAQIMESSGFSYRFKPKRPGVYHFVMEPQPYWEPIEDRFIIHYTKTVVGAFGSEENWMEPLGLPAEIRPLLRPFGNYRGNSFTGQVLINGKPAGSAEVEVEYYNREHSYRAPTDYHITQVITADDNGIFTFTCPLSGWWGFASLSLADYTLKTSAGQEKEVEIGGILWIYLDDYLSP